jgi:hypothetical protein
VIGIALIIGLALTATVAVIVWDELHPPADFGWSASDRREYRIVNMVREQRSQPEMDSRADLRDYLRRHGAGCRGYEEHEPSEDDILTLGGLLDHETATCQGVASYYLMVFSDGADKRVWVEFFAGCKSTAPNKPQYWIEGPNWTVSVMTEPSSDDVADERDARRTARALGARLERSCAPVNQAP